MNIQGWFPSGLGDPGRENLTRTDSQEMWFYSPICHLQPMPLGTNLSVSSSVWWEGVKLLWVGEVWQRPPRLPHRTPNLWRLEWVHQPLPPLWLRPVREDDQFVSVKTRLTNSSQFPRDFLCSKTESTTSKKHNSRKIRAAHHND